MAENMFVLIASNLRPMDAEMMRLHLESLGIEAFIQNQMVFSAREADLGGGAAKLLVREDQAEQALAAIQTEAAVREETPEDGREPGGQTLPEPSPI